MGDSLDFRMSHKEVLNHSLARSVCGLAYVSLQASQQLLAEYPMPLNSFKPNFNANRVSPCSINHYS